MKKFFLLIPGMLLVLVAVFYFWGSNNRFPEDTYHALLHYGPVTEAKSAKDTLSVMTYNIGFLSGMDNNLPVPANPGLYADNLKKVLNLFERLQPELVGFQEIDFGSARSFDVNQMDSLAKYGKYAFGMKGVNWDRNYVPFPYWPPSVQYGRMLSGQAILSKFPLMDGQRIVLNKPEAAPFYYNAFYLDRLIQVTKVAIGEKDTLVLMNVHLEAFDKQTREQQAEYLLNEYRKWATNYPVILLGDFNSRPPYASEIIEQEETISLFLEEPTLGNAIPEEVYRKAEKEFFTFNSEAPYEQIDFIFYTRKDIKPVEVRVVKEAAQISDHLPVLMRFVFLNH
ncbi:endonuclease/exonuclease/phosphatase family protein [Nafulsella turpanensis]|uniref:endonuclease/exonuclease/phosphatase family protein n=1 Tax=Nafulsella turpanensis TaxID=1265690 RepID=UPI00034DD173|nr:endonuclease/exonuclease/phosphatase family protein [Nafulsella turpanensis]